MPGRAIGWANCGASTSTGWAARCSSEWVGHEGYDGLVVGDPQGGWQAEFIHEHAHAAPPVPGREHLLVFYVADRAALAARAAAMDAAGWPRAVPGNPYWSRHGVTYADPDGYHVVLAVPPGA